MLAPLLFGLGISLTATWQAVSAIAGVQSLVLLVMAPFEWRKMTNRPILPRVKLQILFGCLIYCALLLNAAGWPDAPGGGLIMLAISADLFAFFGQFAESLPSFSRKAQIFRGRHRRVCLRNKRISSCPIHCPPDLTLRTAETAHIDGARLNTRGPLQCCSSTVGSRRPERFLSRAVLNCGRWPSRPRAAILSGSPDFFRLQRVSVTPGLAPPHEA
jgi:hypothetical protein